jgi:hypothetical protein
MAATSEANNNKWRSVFDGIVESPSVAWWVNKYRMRENLVRFQ